MQTNCTTNDPKQQTEYQMTQLPLFPTCHYCGQLVDPGLRFCDEICQGYFDVRQTWQRDVVEFADEQANVFGEAML